MIKAGELRVGNKVLYHRNGGLDIVTIAWLSDWQAGYYEQNEAAYPHTFDEYSGIPITLEWLERLAFEKAFHITSYNVLFRQPYLFMICKTDKGFMLYGGEWPIGSSFTFIHQLQNLYFALTGEELPVKA